MSKSENYTTTVRYYNCRTKRNQKYVTIELPANSAFVADERITITLSDDVSRDYKTTKSTDKRLTAGFIMRQMNIGDSTSFDISQWAHVRTIASQIKKMYGCKFSVRKDRHRPENIIVTRLL